MGDFTGEDVTLAEEADVAGDEEVVVADFDDEEALEDEGDELVDEGADEEHPHVGSSLEGERVKEGPEMGWLAGVTGVSEEVLETLPQEHLEALTEAAERLVREQGAHGAEEAARAQRAQFVEDFAERTGRGMDEVGQMLAEYEELIAPYASVADDVARQRVEAMAWAEVERMHPVEEVEEEAKPRRAPGRIRKAGAGNRVAGSGGKRRVSLEGNVVGD